jgi:hypothetical protein
LFLMLMQFMFFCHRHSDDDTCICSCFYLHPQIVEKLLMAAVADADVGVRSSVFKALYRNPAFDDFLAQADILTSIFVALNDEVY